ncbi:hypothetical protein NZD89_09350 [Alicyclobacillus fastidiosus]|uniref:Uncharacterized protein n=1 Tax=Alicyclobacillus fastidiosus TaxID=392011 RepID=A0ABY6ZKY4_9BACL|nr:hypothetical protein [Alicyclobacillus fastidiosus]WAH43562.1 hypothetical protein NZD89_09350 [Alicyclobacillus fastidiosus]GMA59740.1 hypothetical protein GCM10025859_01800 [Alicyclobacillus fastidiosus]
MSDIYGTDLAQTANQDWQTTATADVATVSGPTNLVQALQRRTSTRVGALFYAPSYGNPIYDLLSLPINDDWVSNAETAGQTCLLGDPRVASAQVTVTPNPEARTVSVYYSWTDLNGNTGQFSQEVPVSV